MDDLGREVQALKTDNTQLMARLQSLREQFQKYLPPERRDARQAAVIGSRRGSGSTDGQRMTGGSDHAAKDPAAGVGIGPARRRRIDRIRHAAAWVGIVANRGSGMGRGRRLVEAARRRAASAGSPGRGRLDPGGTLGPGRAGRPRRRLPLPGGRRRRRHGLGAAQRTAEPAADRHAGRHGEPRRPPLRPAARPARSWPGRSPPAGPCPSTSARPPAAGSSSWPASASTPTS